MSVGCRSVEYWPSVDMVSVPTDIYPTYRPSVDRVSDGRHPSVDTRPILYRPSVGRVSVGRVFGRVSIGCWSGGDRYRPHIGRVSIGCRSVEY